MKALKQLIIGLLIGLFIGLWVGINIGKDKPWYSNPLEEKSVTSKIKSSLGAGVKKAGESIEKLGDGIKGKLDN